jgi:GT2 family glycosyltransferase
MHAVSVVIPNWNGRRWLPGCLTALTAQELVPAEVIVVDNGSRDGSLEYLKREHADVRVIPFTQNTGFAHAANVGIAAAAHDVVAMLNTDVELASDWLRRMVEVLAADPRVGSVACKMLQLASRDLIYDAGDVLRRDGQCVQRGRFEIDVGRFDTPGEVFGACAGAALYRRDAVLAVGGFDERYFAYLEDVDLALRLRLAGWICRYEPAVAWHAGAASAAQLPGGPQRLVARNTLLLVAKAFPARWLPLVAYRQCGWAWHAWLERRLTAHLAALASALPLLPGAVRQRRRLRGQARTGIEEAVPARPFHGPRAAGHPSQFAGAVIRRRGAAAGPRCPPP